MSGLLDDLPGASAPREPCGCSAMVVGDQRYTNSAAKFWISLLDEAQRKCPDCTCMELAASCSHELDARRLRPELELQEGILQLMHEDLSRVLRETVAALELLGPPGPVELVLLEGETERVRGTLPMDSVDAEIFPYLLTWLLQWAALPETVWNREFITGVFVASDPRSATQYEVEFTLHNRHLSEGLYRRSVRLQSAVTAVA